MAKHHAAPTTTHRPVFDTYHGVTVCDPYRWLENGNDAEVQTWMAAQNEATTQTLGERPEKLSLRQDLTHILSAQQTRFSSIIPAGDRLFALAHIPPAPRPQIVVIPRSDWEDIRILVDPHALDPTDGTTIDWFVPAPNGAHVAVSLSKDGTEEGDAHIFCVETGACIEIVPRANNGLSGGALAWTADSAGFCYRHFPPDSSDSAPARLVSHRLGDDPRDDTPESGIELPPHSLIVSFFSHPSTGRMALRALPNVRPPGLVWVREANGEWWRLAGPKDHIYDIANTPNGDWVLLSRKEHDNGAIGLLPANARSLDAMKVVVPPSDRILGAHRPDRQGLVVSHEAIFYTVQDGGPTRLDCVGIDGRPRDTSSLPGPIGIDRIVPCEDGVLLAVSSNTRSDQWLVHSGVTGKTEDSALSAKPAIQWDGVTVIRELARSKDGTMVPVTLLMPPGTERGANNPCILTGYGGFALTRQPCFAAEIQALMDRGVIWATAHIRGGGEYGRRWHLEGCMHNKQNGFDDFAAVLDHLAIRGYAQPDRTCIYGGSNGAILMGAMLTQHPDKMCGVLSTIGLYDMLRLETHPNGKGLTGEYGSVTNADDFQVLHAYSPYQNVGDDVVLPPTLLVAAENDARVDTMHSRKMTARMQAAAGQSGPILLRVHAGQGHLSGSLDHFIDRWTEQFDFLLQQLGL